LGFDFMKHEAVASFYNDIQQKFGDDYESGRWFRSPVTRSHFKMATTAISEVVSECHFTKCLELGPGAGTWTKLLRTFAPSASYTLLDISDTMLSIAEKNLSADSKNIEFVTSDFLAYETERTYDFFFSSRAIEYIVDKKTAVEKMYALLESEGEGVVITKNPRYWGDRLLGRKTPDLHKNQIAPSALTELLVEAGFTVELLRPVTMTVPFFKCAWLNDIAFALLHRSWFPILNSIFMESYIVHFKKHGN
jgi:ubiquinone/menaquinone biosynthesis C-methylase UbiE